MGIFKRYNTLLRRLELATALVLTLIVVLLHLVFLRNAGALWRDEVTSINVATMHSLSDVGRCLELHPFPMLTHLVLRLWSFITGGKDIVLRVFGFLMGVSIVGVLWLNLRLLANSVPLISLSLFALSPLVIRTGDSIRPYGLGIFLILLTFSFLWKVADEAKPRHIAAAAVAAVLSVQCLFQNAILLAAIIFAGVVVTVRNRRPRRAALLVAIGIVAALSLLPYWTTLKGTEDWVIILRVPSRLIPFWPTLARALGAAGGFVVWIWIGVCILGICTAGYILSGRSSPDVLRAKRDTALYCLVAMITGTVSFLLFLKFTNIPPNPWYYLLVMALAAVSLDCILANTNSGAILRIALVILIGSLTLTTTRKKVGQRQTNVDLIASKLAESASEDDMILMNPWYLAISFQRYYNGAADVMMLPPLEAVKVHRYDLVKRKMASANPMEPLISQIAGTLRAGNKIWVVGRLNFILEEVTSPKSLPPAPNSAVGWSYGTYMKIWREQVGHCIQWHCLKGNILSGFTGESISPYERCSVMLLQGWKD
jgi:hypothetical protein